MKIIRTPLDWESNPDDNWLHSVDYIETADISVDELESESRTGTVTFTQDETSDQKEVTVIQKRATFYYSVGTNYGSGATFNIGGELVVSDENGVATRVWTPIPGSTAPETMLATPETDIRTLAVNPSLVEFPAEGGEAHETFTWTNWNKTGTTLPRWSNSTPQDFINSASTSIPSVGSVSGSSWLTVNVDGHITASENAGNERSGTVQYSYCGKTATVQVNQEEKPITEGYFGVKTTSKLAEGQHVVFTVNGEDLQPVDFSESGEYYIATITALPEANVSVSCNISRYAIGTDPSELIFNPTGGTKTVYVFPEKVSLYESHHPLTGCTDLSDLSKLYTITETSTECDYSSRIESGGDSFTINSNSITANENTTHSIITGSARFEITEGTREHTNVTLKQEPLHWFSFKSEVSGNPTNVQVTFYNSPIPNPGFKITTVPYDASGDIQSVEWEDSINTDIISYKIEGLSPSNFISASTSSVTFNNIEMLSGETPEHTTYYYLSNVKEDVTVSAYSVSYRYEKKVNDSPVTSQDYSSGVIESNEEVEVNATANTSNEITTSAKYNSGSSSNWSYVTNPGDSENSWTVSVKVWALQYPKSGKRMTLTYALKDAPTVTAQTTFTVPSGATSSINLENIALSSKTAFGDACNSPGVVTIPTGSSAFNFTFWPSSRTAMATFGGAASALGAVQVTELRYIEPGPGENGWMLFYPYKPEDVPGDPEDVPKNSFANFTAKVYALSYNTSTQYQSGKNDVWTLGPLVYRAPNELYYPAYTEVIDFEFLQHESGTGYTTQVDMCKTDPDTSQWPTNYIYPRTCPFKGSSALSANNEYFQFVKFENGQSATTSSTSGSISDDRKNWAISGYAMGGVDSTSSNPNKPNFRMRIQRMRERNVSYFHCVPNMAANCDYSDFHTPTPDGMAHAFSGTLETNLLGIIKIKAVYHGLSSGADDTNVVYSVPADSYVVTPKNPGDTTSVIYDAETNTYLIYDIENVIVLHKQDYTVVPEIDLEEFKTPIEGEIIGPPRP